MFKRIIVSTTGGDPSWRAVQVGDVLASKCDAELEIVSVAPTVGEMRTREERVRSRLAAESTLSTTVNVTTDALAGSVGATLAAHLAGNEDALPVMVTAGRGRSEALLGSVAEELLLCRGGPVVLVGPGVDLDHLTFGGDVIVPIDGSEHSEAALPFAAALAAQLDLHPWITSVLDPALRIPSDVSEGSYAARLAARLHDEYRCEADYEVLHDVHPARAIVDFADGRDAGLIVASTHGRTGLARLALGSVAMTIVHHAPCPVVLVRPHSLAVAHDPTAEQVGMR